MAVNDATRMKVLKLIQIGDIHYPDLNHRAVVDRKDQGVSPSLVQAISTDQVQNVARHLLKLAEDGKTAGFLICGDLTTYGKIEGYKECVAYLNKVIEQLGGATKVADDRLHVVPGNHDVDRKLCEPASTNIYSKFQPLSETWNSIDRNILTISGPRHTCYEEPGCKLDVFSLNSCIGCGEMRFLPRKLKDKLSAVFAEFDRENPANEVFETLGEQLDTPAFVEEDMTSLTEQIAGLDAKTIPVVLAHHNILPQSIPRIDIYTDVINGGLVRTRLVECERPIIYCHGHIHSDPIELVAAPRQEQGFLITASAPKFEEGFNAIEVWYGQKEYPLGCVITAHRAREDGSVAIDVSKTVRIPLRQLGDYLNFGHPKIGEFMACVPAENFVRWNTVLSSVRESRNSAIKSQTLADVLREAEWFRLVEILNLEKPVEHWQLKKLVP